MAIYSSDYGPGDVDTNVFDEGFLATLLYFAPEGGQLSENSKDIVYNLGGGGSAVFSSDAGFDGLWSGTVNAISYVVDGTVVSGGTGLAIDGTALRDAMAAGDTATINRLAWSGNDVLNGGASDDTLRGFDGRDTILGGAGNDRLDGRGGVDTLIGGSGNDRISGLGGKDTLYGDIGKDQLNGGAGDDRLSGGAGNDKLLGGYGDDLLVGGIGLDTLTGSGGHDVFRFAPGDSGRIRTNADIITDFRHAEIDRIDLSAFDTNATRGGIQPFLFIGTAAFTPGGGKLAGELHYVHADGYTYIEGDANRDGVADVVIALKGTLDLVASDFIL